MALTALTLPQVGSYRCPWDAMTAFTDTQTLTATGYLNNLNSGLIDLGGSNPVSAVGRVDAVWNVDITAIDVSSGDETYWLALLGSNDSAFGNGNVELLAFHDLAAASSGRVIATLLGVTPAIPSIGVAGSFLKIPFCNLMQGIAYRWLKCRAVIGGTTPTITMTSWISKAQIDV